MIKLKVMIVEDESLERMLLKHYLEAEAERFELVMEASFALEALEYMDEHTVDIVITDINMPVMDGLEMARRILAMDPNVQVIVTTGYNDFDHAQSAIKIGIADYLVKPVDAKDFTAILARVRDKLLKRQGDAVAPSEIQRQIAERMPALRDTFLRRLVTRDMDESLVRQTLAFYQTALPGEWMQVAVAVLPKPEADPMRALFTLFTLCSVAKDAAQHALVFTMESNRVVLVLGFDSDQSFDFDTLKRLMDAAMDTPVALGAGNTAQGIQGLRRSFAQATRAVNCHPFLGTQQTISYRDLGTVEGDPGWLDATHEAMIELEQLDFYLRCGIDADVRGWVAKHFPDAQEQLEAARVRAALAVISLTGMQAEPSASLKKTLPQVLDMGTVAEVRDLLLAQMGEATSTLARIRVSAATRQVQPILDYICDNLADPALSLHETSRAFFYNASYLSRVFKQNTGMSFREYVNNQRIEQARKLLDDPDAKAYEVGVRVGIEDPNYFSTLFKKYAGMTIKQYRANIGHG